MDAHASEAQLTRLQLAGAAALVAVCLLTLGNAMLRSPEVPFLTAFRNAEWIAAPLPRSSDAITVDLEAVPAFVFTKRFRIPEPGARAADEPVVVEARALRDLDLALNGRAITAEPAPASWREPHRIDVSAGLRPGANELRATVRNPRGPALLALRVEGRGLDVATDTTWEVAWEGVLPQLAVLASDTRLNAESLSMPTPGVLLGARAGSLALLFLASALAYALLGPRLPAHLRARMPEVVLGLVTLYWIALFALKLSRMPVLMGFDVPGHLEYIDWLLARHALPLATDGWSTYHPPLFYALTASLVGAFDVARDSELARSLYRLVSFLAGLANVWLTWLLARRLFRGRPLEASLAVGFAGLLPMNVYLSAYVSNEPLHGALASLAVWAACVLLLERGCPPLRLALVALALGLALLTKFTSLLLVPVIAFFLGFKRWAVDARPPARAVGSVAALLLGIALVAGWYYARNWAHFGTPLVLNTHLPGSLGWWEQPGFHTADYYTGFGEVLRHPFFAGYHSVWDGLYSTFWGDGLVAGMVSLHTRHLFWSYDFMTLGYTLALPATGLLALGFALTVRAALRDPDPGRRMALSLVSTLVFVVGFALVYVTLPLPYYAQAKAFYGLAAIVPLAIVAAHGLAAIPGFFPGDRFLALRALYFGWLGALAGVLVLSYLG